MSKVVRAENADGKFWYHLSARKDQNRYRRLLVDGLSGPIDEPLVCDLELSEAEVARLLGKFPRLDQAAEWASLLGILEAGDYQPILSLEGQSVQVPRTRLRTFRFAFRDWTQRLKRSQARFFAENVDCLKELWNLSVKAMSAYNLQQPFHEGARKTQSTECKDLSQIRNTLDAQSYFACNFGERSQLVDVPFQYLDREIAPLRTPNGHFVGGGAATSSGCGGMDVLASLDGKFCAGEIKVGNDSELFEALLQALWYGSELATDNQLARMKLHTRSNMQSSSKINVAVFSINQRQDPTRADTLKVVNKINSGGGFTNLGKIYLFENVKDNWRYIE